MKSETINPQRIELEGQSYVVVPERHYRNLMESFTAKTPQSPRPLSNGNYDALEVLRFELARKIIAARQAAGWTQAELARQSNVRAENLNRIEKAKVTADEATVKKIEKALKKVRQVV